MYPFVTDQQGIVRGWDQVVRLTVIGLICAASDLLQQHQQYHRQHPVILHNICVAKNLSLAYFNIPSLWFKLSHKITFPTIVYFFAVCNALIQRITLKFIVASSHDCKSNPPHPLFLLPSYSRRLHSNFLSPHQ